MLGPAFCVCFLHECFAQDLMKSHLKIQAVHAKCIILTHKGFDLLKEFEKFVIMDLHLWKLHGFFSGSFHLFRSQSVLTLYSFACRLTGLYFPRFL